MTTRIHFTSSLAAACVLSLLTGNYAECAWIKLRHFRIEQYFEFGGFGDHHAHRDDVARLALRNAETHLGRNVDRTGEVNNRCPAFPQTNDVAEG